LSQRLSCLLRRERYRVAELFETVNMVTFDPSPISLVKIIGPQIAVGFLGTQDVIDNH